MTIIPLGPGLYLTLTFPTCTKDPVFVWSEGCAHPLELALQVLKVQCLQKSWGAVTSIFVTSTAEQQQQRWKFLCFSVFFTFATFLYVVEQNGKQFLRYFSAKGGTTCVSGVVSGVNINYKPELTKQKIYVNIFHISYITAINTNWKCSLTI